MLLKVKEPYHGNHLEIKIMKENILNKAQRKKFITYKKLGKN